MKRKPPAQTKTDAERLEDAKTFIVVRPTTRDYVALDDVFKIVTDAVAFAASVCADRYLHDGDLLDIVTAWAASARPGDVLKIPKIDVALVCRVGIHVSVVEEVTKVSYALRRDRCFRKQPLPPGVK